VRRFWGIRCGKGGDKPVQDTDDGKLYFHTHDLWQVLDDVEKFYQCEIYGVLAVQDTVENLRHYLEFCETQKNTKYFKMPIDDVPKDLIIEAHNYACHKVNQHDYDEMLDCISEYIVERI